jgi:hypothetical protein
VQGCSTHSLWAKCCPWHSVILPARAFNMRKCLLPLHLAKPRQKAKAIFKTCDLFIYGDMYIVTTSLCKNMLRKTTPWSRFWIASVHQIFLLSAGYFLLHDAYENPRKTVHIITHTHYSFFILCIQFILPTCRPNSVKAAQKVWHKCFSVTTPAICFNSFHHVTLTEQWLWFLECMQCNGQAILGWSPKRGLQQTNPCSQRLSMNEWKCKHKSMTQPYNDMTIR